MLQVWCFSFWSSGFLLSIKSCLFLLFRWGKVFALTKISITEQRENFLDFSHISKCATDRIKGDVFLLLALIQRQVKLVATNRREEKNWSGSTQTSTTILFSGREFGKSKRQSTSHLINPPFAASCFHPLTSSGIFSSLNVTLGQNQNANFYHHLSPSLSPTHSALIPFV